MKSATEVYYSFIVDHDPDTDILVQRATKTRGLKYPTGPLLKTTTPRKRVATKSKLSHVGAIDITCLKIQMYHSLLLYPCRASITIEI